MDVQGHILVVGAAWLDYKGRPYSTLDMLADNPGQVRITCGGVARNIAENLARLDMEVILLTALGEDYAGEIVLRHCQESGINMQYVRRYPEANTGAYVALFHPEGTMLSAVSDNRIMQYVDEAYLDAHSSLFSRARMLVIDLNMIPSTLDYLMLLARRHNLLVAADPTSAARAPMLRPYLDQLYIVTPNAAETTSLCGLEIPAQDMNSAVGAAHHLVGLGAKIVIVTMGENGLAYADGRGTGHIPAVKTQVVDDTGAGDSLSAGVIFGLLNDVPLDDAMRLGVAAASLTLQSELSVSPLLTPDLLYNSLVV